MTGGFSVLVGETEGESESEPGVSMFSLEQGAQDWELANWLVCIL